MRCNVEHKTMDMEARDINYILPAYIRQYLYASQNEDPTEIIFPMFPSVPHPYKPGVVIPVKYVGMDEPIVKQIVEDGKNIPETPVAKDPEGPDDGDPLPGPTGEEEKKEETISPAKAAILKQQGERKPKQPPGGDIGTGHADGLGSRDVGFDRKLAKDLRPEAQVDESKEVETEIKKQ